MVAKTIVEKLNLQKYQKAAVLNLPEGADYLAELADYDKELADTYDLIFAFVLDMESILKMTQSKITGYGM